MSDKFDIEELLKEHLSHASEPNPDLFDQIEAQILTDKKKRRGFFFWIWIIGLGGILCLEGSAVKPNVDHLSTSKFLTPKTALECKAGQEPVGIKRTKPDYPNDHFKVNSTSQPQHFNTTNNSTDLTSAYQPVSENVENTAEEESHENRIVRAAAIQSAASNTNLPLKIAEISSQKIDLIFTQKTSITAMASTSFLSTYKPGKTQESLRTDSLPINETELLVSDLIIDSTTAETDSISIVENAVDSVQAPITNEPKYGISLTAGPTLYDISLFKPYFKSGALSNRSFSSSGVELGFGIYRKIGQRFKVQLAASLNQKNTSFTYDLMIGENDFFSLYENNESIPLENLDDPNSCNCFLAEDASLSYTLRSIYFSLGTSFDLIQKPKYVFGSQLELSGNLSNGLEINASSILAFPENQKEQFNTFRVGLGFNYNYKFTERVFVGIRPTFYYQLNKASNLLSAPLKELSIPLTVSFGF